MTDKELNDKLMKHYQYLNKKDVSIEFSKAYICIDLKDVVMKVNDMRSIKNICKFIRTHMATDDKRIIMDSNLNFYVTSDEYKKMPKFAKKCPCITI